MYHLQIRSGKTPEELRVGFLLPAAIIVLLDQAAKQFFWYLGKNFDIIDGVFKITLVKNTGAAFGMFPGGRAFFVVASILASIVIVVLGLRTPKDMFWRRLTLGLILGGAVGNLIDRMFFGEVIDFFDMGIGMHRWPVYNVADIAVTLGAIGLMISLLRSDQHPNPASLVVPPDGSAESPGDRDGG
jgi:signal peptidase II